MKKIIVFTLFALALSTEVFSQSVKFVINKGQTETNFVNYPTQAKNPQNFVVAYNPTQAYAGSVSLLTFTFRANQLRDIITIKQRRCGSNCVTYSADILFAGGETGSYGLGTMTGRDAMWFTVAEYASGNSGSPATYVVSGYNLATQMKSWHQIARSYDIRPFSISIAKPHADYPVPSQAFWYVDFK